MTTEEVLREFIGDVEAAYPDGELKIEWPDLYETYLHAKEALRDEWWRKP